VKLELVRRWKSDDATLGTLTIDGVFECYTLEDPVRVVDDNADGVIDAAEVARVKIPGATAIPYGTYPIEMHRSPKFGRVPKILNVPGYTDILMHAGNKAADTKGCPLVGKVRRPNSIEQSRPALEALVEKLDAATTAGDAILIEIREAFGGLGDAV
jgi:hypothetical protein